MKSDQAERVIDIASKLFSAIDGQEVPDVGIAMTQAMAIFLAHIELETKGDGQAAYDLLVRGLQQLFEATMGDIENFRAKGMSKEEIHEELAKFIPDTLGHAFRKTGIH